MTAAGGRASQIDSYEKLYEEVAKCENSRVFHGWLQCDCRPFKQALLNTIKRWSLMFKRHLSNHVVNRWALGQPAARPGRSHQQPGGLWRGREQTGPSRWHPCPAASPTWRPS